FRLHVEMQMAVNTWVFIRTRLTDRILWIKHRFLTPDTEQCRRLRPWLESVIKSLMREVRLHSEVVTIFPIRVRVYHHRVLPLSSYWNEVLWDIKGPRRRIWRLHPT